MIKTTILALLVALRAVESSSGTDPRARGNDLQITYVCIKDVNRLYGTRYTLADRTDPRRSQEIALLYLGHWVSVTRARRPDLAWMGTEELAARIWHRGPTQFEDAQGSAYWNKVRAHIGGTK